MDDQAARTSPRPRLLDRRAFLAALGTGMAAGILRGRPASAAGWQPAPRWSPDNGGYRSLEPAGPDLALPPGFRYVAYGPTGSPMSDGRPTPPAHDGMGAFRGPGDTVHLVRNHEVDGPGEPIGPNPYDPRSRGGTTTVVFDPGRERFLRSFVSLSGTNRNCSGGTTPWGTWISCEENAAGPGDGYRKRHGYCFEVDPAAAGSVAAEPLRAMGRFLHEAVAVDPRTGVVYLTEDRPEAGFYRFVPERPGRLGEGGILQMLAVAAEPGYDTRTGQTVGRVLPARWVHIADPDPAGGGLDAVFGQGRDGGGAVFRRLEGCCVGQGGVFFTSTDGGDAGLGQVWAYEPGPAGGRLVLVLEPTGPGRSEHPDGITVGHRGGLVLCEDGPGRDRLLGVDPQGRVFALARNIGSAGEFTGAAFSPCGRWLFVNVQVPGVTYAITGPWRRGCL